MRTDHALTRAVAHVAPAWTEVTPAPACRHAGPRFRTGARLAPLAVTAKGTSLPAFGSSFGPAAMGLAVRIDNVFPGLRPWSPPV